MMERLFVAFSKRMQRCCRMFPSKADAKISTTRKPEESRKARFRVASRLRKQNDPKRGNVCAKSVKSCLRKRVEVEDEEEVAKQSRRVKFIALLL